jgi:hypothetical protein
MRIKLRGRSCVASLKATCEREKRTRRARPASTAAAGPTGHSHAAHPAAAPAAGAARAAAQTTVPARGTQDATRVVQRGRAEGVAAAAPAHPAEQREAAPQSSADARAHDAAAAAAVGAAPARSADQHESASMWLLAERERNGGDPAAGRLRPHAAAEDDLGMSDASLTPGTLDSAPEPDDAADDDPHAGGACCPSPDVHWSVEELPSPDSLCLLIAAMRLWTSIQSELLGGPQVALAAVLPTLSMPPQPRQLRPPRRAARPTSGGRPRAMPHCATPMTEERRPGAGPASGTGPWRPGHAAVTRLSSRVRRWARLRRRHASKARQSTRTVMRETRARHCAGWACAARTRALQRRWRVSARALPSRRAAWDFAPWSAAVQELLSHGSLQGRQRVSLSFTHVGSVGHAVVSSADTASVHHSMPPC